MENPPNRLRWLLHTLAILYYTMGFMVRFAWPPLIPMAAPDLGMGMSSAGLYMSAFYIGYVLTQIPGGILSDRYGARLVIGLALLLEALGTLGVGLAPNFATGFAFRLLTGMGAGAIYASCIRYVNTLFSPKETGLAFGLMMMAPAGVGVILPNVLMPWLSELVSWRGAFQIMSVIVFVMGFVALAVVRDKPDGKGGGGAGLAAFLGVLRNRNLLSMALGGFWLMWVLVCFVSWSNTYIKELGYTLEAASHVMLVYGLAGLVVSPFGGVLVQKARSPKRLFILLFLFMSPCLWLFGQVESFTALCMLAGLLGAWLGLANPILPFLSTAFASKEQMATAGGVTGCIFQSGAIVGPWVVGLSVDFYGSFSAAWPLMAAAALLGAVCLIPMGAPARR